MPASVIYFLSMAVEAPTEGTIVQFLGLTPVNYGRATTISDLIHPLSGLPIKEIPYNPEPLFRDGIPPLKAWLVLSGALMITRAGLEGQPVIDIISAPALVGAEALTGEVYEGTAEMFTKKCSWQELLRSERWRLYQDPVDARTLVLASANTNKGRRRWTDLIVEEVPERLDFAFEFFEVLGREHQMVLLTQVELAGVIGSSRESVNKKMSEPDRNAVYRELVRQYFFRPPTPKIPPHKKLRSISKRDIYGGNL